MSDPFGNNPFGQPPYGPTPHGAPPVFSAVTPVPRPANALATLSVVFAFVFAPAGAVLGHLGLAEVRRTGQPGRGRALTGIVASYTIISVVIVALTVWAISRPNATTSPSGPGPGAAHPIAVADLPTLLPGLEQLETILDDRDLIPATTVTQLEDVPGSTIPPGCRVDFSATDSHVYKSGDVAGVYRADYTGTLNVASQGPPYYVQLAVVAFADPDRAAAAVRAMAAAAQDCANRTLRLTGPSGNTDLFESVVHSAAINVTSVQTSSTTSLQSFCRALASKANVAIDVLVKGAGMATPDTAGIANAIQANILR